MKNLFLSLIFITLFFNMKAQEKKSYYDSGELKEIGNFIDGKKDGEWKKYHKNGQLYSVKIWDNGKLMNITSCFDVKGNKLDKGTLKDGNGTVKEYDIDGKLLKEKKVIDGYSKSKDLHVY